jgi:hypothetical protein
LAKNFPLSLNRKKKLNHLLKRKKALKISRLSVNPSLRKFRKKNHLQRKKVLKRRSNQSRNNRETSLHPPRKYRLRREILQAHLKMDLMNIDAVRYLESRSLS